MCKEEDRRVSVLRMFLQVGFYWDPLPTLRSGQVAESWKSDVPFRHEPSCPSSCSLLSSRSFECKEEKETHWWIFCLRWRVLIIEHLPHLHGRSVGRHALVHPAAVGLLVLIFLCRVHRSGSMSVGGRIGTRVRLRRDKEGWGMGTQEKKGRISPRELIAPVAIHLGCCFQ